MRDGNSGLSKSESHNVVKPRFTARVENPLTGLAMGESPRWHDDHPGARKEPDHEIFPSPPKLSLEHLAPLDGRSKL